MGVLGLFFCGFSAIVFLGHQSFSEFVARVLGCSLFSAFAVQPVMLFVAYNYLSGVLNNETCCFVLVMSFLPVTRSMRCILWYVLKASFSSMSLGAFFNTCGITVGYVKVHIGCIFHSGLTLRVQCTHSLHFVAICGSLKS